MGVWVMGVAERTNQDEKSFVDVLSDLWRARISMAVFGIIGLVCVGAVLAVATPRYKASMLISPASPINGAEISSLMGNDNLFALRYLVQRVGQENSSDFLRFENIYSGRSVAELLLKDAGVYKGTAQDAHFRFDNVKDGWNASELAEYIEKSVNLEPVNGTSLRRLVYSHPDPEFAVYFLSRLHEQTDALIRKNIFTETSERIEYLQSAIAKTLNPENRKALTTLLLEQERLRMLVSIDQPYAAAVIEPASSSVKAVWPDPIFLMLSFVGAFAIMGFIIHTIRQERRMRLYKNAVSMKEEGWIRSETSRQNNQDSSLFSKTGE